MSNYARGLQGVDDQCIFDTPRDGSTPAASTIDLDAGVGVLGSATTRSLTQVPDCGVDLVDRETRCRDNREGERRGSRRSAHSCMRRLCGNLSTGTSTGSRCGGLQGSHSQQHGTDRTGWPSRSDRTRDQGPGDPSASQAGRGRQLRTLHPLRQGVAVCTSSGGTSAPDASAAFASASPVRTSSRKAVEK